VARDHNITRPWLFFHGTATAIEVKTSRSRFATIDTARRPP
jgi:hypothetical protein